MPAEHSAGVVLVHGDQYLLLQYPEGHWDFPKGKVEPGETPEHAALRETKEETGIDATLVPGFTHTITYYFQRGVQTVHKDVIFFLAESSTREVTLSHEHHGWVWLTYEDALRKITYQNARDVLERAHASRQ